VERISGVDTAWVLISAALVMLMTPALGLFYSGLVREKNALSTITHSFFILALVSVQWVLVGYTLAFGPDLYGLIGRLDWAGLRDVGVEPNPTYAASIPHLAFMAFQLMFAVLTPALISGAFAERKRFTAFALFSLLWATLVYDPVAHWVWGDGGWLRHLGAIDFAGGTVVHINAGMAALVLALLIGKRAGFGRTPYRPHNIPFVMLGAALLWFGWFGFNVGSIVFVEGDGGELDTAQFMTETGVTWMNTTLATCAAMLAWLLVERVMHGRATSLGAASGVVAGLVAITPACGAVGIYGALIIGVVAGAACAYAVGLKYKFGYDDSLDVVGVHLVGGLVGTIMIGFVSSGDAPGAIDGLFYGGGVKPLVVQVLTALFAVAWSGLFTLIIGLAIKYTLGWRISEEAEVEGIDLDQHSETAYDLHTGLGGLPSSSPASAVLAKAPANEGANA
jgi:ammonium transporter, Amt family